MIIVIDNHTVLRKKVMSLLTEYVATEVEEYVTSRDSHSLVTTMQNWDNKTKSKKFTFPQYNHSILVVCTKTYISGQHLY